MSAMISLLLGSAWGLVVLWSFVAMGRLLARLAGIRTPGDIWLRAGWGMAGMVVVGGWLNLLGIARPRVSLALVLGAIILDALLEANGFFRAGRIDPLPDQASVRGGSNRSSSAWALAVFVFIAFKYIASVGVPFNANDDQLAYLYMVARLVETGSVGLDPFSNRQLFSLNGQSFLLGLMYSGSSLQCLHLLDPRIGWIVIGGSNWSIVRKELGGSTKDASLVTALVLMVNQPSTMNLRGT